MTLIRTHRFLCRRRRSIKHSTPAISRARSRGLTPPFGLRFLRAKWERFAVHANYTTATSERVPPAISNLRVLKQPATLSAESSRMPVAASGRGSGAPNVKANEFNPRRRESTLPARRINQRSPISLTSVWLTIPSPLLSALLNAVS